MLLARALVAFGVGCSLVGRAVKSCGGTVQLLSNRSAVGLYKHRSAVKLLGGWACSYVGSKMASLGLGSLSGGRRSG